MKKHGSWNLRVVAAIFITAFIFLFITLYNRADKMSKQYRLTHTSPAPSVKPTQSPPTYNWIEPSPTPNKQASTLEFSPLLFPEVGWEDMGVAPASDTEEINRFSDFAHKSYQKWQATERQANGEADSYKYFHNRVLAYYENELGKLGWQSEDVADGPGGAIRRIFGYKDDYSRDVIIRYDLSSETNECGSGGCKCPCRYNYTLYVSSVDKIE